MSPFLAELSGPVFELFELVLVDRWFGLGQGSEEVIESEGGQSQLFRLDVVDVHLDHVGVSSFLALFHRSEVHLAPFLGLDEPVGHLHQSHWLVGGVSH